MHLELIRNLTTTFCETKNIRKPGHSVSRCCKDCYCLDQSTTLNKILLSTLVLARMRQEMPHWVCFSLLLSTSRIETELQTYSKTIHHTLMHIKHMSKF